MDALNHLPIYEQPTTILLRQPTMPCPFEAGDFVAWDTYRNWTSCATVQFVTPTAGLLDGNTHEVTVNCDGQTLVLLWPNGGEGSTLRLMEQATTSDAIPAAIDADTPDEDAEREYYAGLIEAYVDHVKAVQKSVLAEIQLARRKSRGDHETGESRVCQQFNHLVSEGLKIASIIYFDDCVDLGGRN